MAGIRCCVTFRLRRTAGVGFRRRRGGGGDRSEDEFQVECGGVEKLVVKR